MLLGGPRDDSALHPSKVDNMSTRSGLELMVKAAYPLVVALALRYVKQPS